MEPQQFLCLHGIFCLILESWALAIWQYRGSARYDRAYPQDSLEYRPYCCHHEGRSALPIH